MRPDAPQPAHNVPPADAPRPAATPQRPEGEVGRLAQQCQHLRLLLGRLGPGPRSELRRLDPDAPGGPAFWGVMVHLLPETDALGLNDGRRAWLERRWAVVIGMAVLGLDLPTEPLGTALARAGLSPLRLTRLLEAEDQALEFELRQAVRFLASKGRAARLEDLAGWVLQGHEAFRRRVARDYFYHAPSDSPGGASASG